MLRVSAPATIAVGRTNLRRTGSGRESRTSAYAAARSVELSRTRSASFVVFDGARLAVAVRYAPPAVPVPQVVVLARDVAAQRVKTHARRWRIPVVEDAALARLLYAHGRIGLPIVPDAYVAVAQLIAAFAREGMAARGET